MEVWERGCVVELLFDHLLFAGSALGMCWTAFREESHTAGEQHRLLRDGEGYT